MQCTIKIEYVSYPDTCIYIGPFNNLSKVKLFMHLCQCFLCYFLAWEQLKAYVMLC